MPENEADTSELDFLLNSMPPGTDRHDPIWEAACKLAYDSTLPYDKYQLACRLLEGYTSRDLRSVKSAMGNRLSKLEKANAASQKRMDELLREDVQNLPQKAEDIEADLPAFDRRPALKKLAFAAVIAVGLVGAGAYFCSISAPQPSEPKNYNQTPPKYDMKNNTVPVFDFTK